MAKSNKTPLLSSWENKMPTAYSIEMRIWLFFRNEKLWATASSTIVLYLISNSTETEVATQGKPLLQHQEEHRIVSVTTFSLKTQEKETVKWE